MTARGEGRRGGRRWLVVLLGAGLLGTAFLWQDRGTLERGNRMYRGGDTIGAAELYRGLAGPSRAGAGPASYNLGTALLTLDPEEAGLRLGRAIEAGDSALAQRGSYNLAYRALTSVGRSVELDSTLALLADAVAHNRMALRLEPGDADARWNLALSQRMLDSLSHPAREPEGEEPPGEDETRIDETALARSETGDGVSGLEPEVPHAAENIGERQGAAEGAREAWTSQDPGPLTEAEALRLLATVTDNPEQLIRGTLWSHRPDVAWWMSQPYPGGGW